MDSHLPKIPRNRSSMAGASGISKEDDLIEPAPKRRAEQALVVGRRNRDSITSKSIQDLKERIHNPLDLLRAIVGVANVATSPDWQQSARRLVEILILGARPLK